MNETIQRILIANSITPEPPAPSCAYPLDATESEVQKLGSAGRLSMDSTEQIGTYTVQSGLESAETYAAGPEGISSQSAELIDFASGKKALKVTFSRSSALDSANLAQSFSVVTTGFEARVTVARSAPSLLIRINNVTVYTTTPSVSDSVVVIFDSATSTVTAIVNGTEVVLSNNAYTPDSFLLAENTREGGGLDAGLAGEELSVALITKAADIPEAQGYGATTVCGDAI